jgi:PhoH-like ATPase
LVKVVTVEHFNNWQAWYSQRKITHEQLGLEEGVVLHENQPIILGLEDEKQIGIVKGEYVVPILDYYPSKIGAKNDEQKIALSILKDEDIPLKIISGVAGSGKTMLACAHAMQQLRHGDKTKIVIAKSMTPVGREIGHLKGSLEDKVKPWLGPFYDNFLQCGVPPYELEDMMDRDVMEITPITFIQGRSITNAVIIIDEVQNLDLNILKQIITRAAEGSEIILLGDQTQVFERVNNSSITTLVERGRDSRVVGAVHLSKSLRSPLADWAVKNL